MCGKNFTTSLIPKSFFFVQLQSVKVADAADIPLWTATNAYFQYELIQ